MPRKYPLGRRQKEMIMWMIAVGHPMTWDELRGRYSAEVIGRAALHGRIEYTWRDPFGRAGYVVSSALRGGITT